MKQEINPLLGILNPRKMPKVLEALDGVLNDKVWAINMVQAEAYPTIRNFFLDHKQYTHLFFMSDDGLVESKNVIKLINTVQDNPDKKIIAGICNVDMESQKDDLAATRKPVSPLWSERVYDSYKRGELSGLHQVPWNGFALMSIERSVVENIPFRNDCVPGNPNFGKSNFGQSYDVMFCHDCADNNIPIWTDFDNYFWHLKGQDGSKTFGVGTREVQVRYDHRTEDGEYIHEIIYRRQADKTKLIAAISGYNEEENIEDLLHSLQRITDLDAVYFADGRYLDDGVYDTPQPSTDKTKEIFTTSKIGLFNKYFFGAQKWKSQSHKRNWLWSMIDRKENCDCWILSIDADEEIITLKNWPLRLKPVLKNIEEDFCLVESGPHTENMNNPLEFFQPRVFKNWRGLHWHTGDVMVTHDREHNLVSDHGNGIIAKPYKWLKNFMIFNKWSLRDPEKIKQVQEYRKNRVLGGECEWIAKNGA